MGRKWNASTLDVRIASQMTLSFEVSNTSRSGLSLPPGSNASIGSGGTIKPGVGIGVVSDGSVETSSRGFIGYAGFASQNPTFGPEIRH
jgi:hypothetical protein